MLQRENPEDYVIGTGEPILSENFVRLPLVTKHELSGTCYSGSVILSPGGGGSSAL